MTKRMTAVAAAVKAAASGNSIFAFASRKDAVPQDDKLDSVLASAQFTEFSCTSCGTSMHARSNTSPFCVTCGADEAHVHEVKANVSISVNAASELVVLQCTTCDHSTILESKVANAISAAATGGNPIHCSCCGGPMYVVAEAEDGTVDTPEMKTPDEAPDPSDDFDAPKPTSARKLAAGMDVEMEDDVSLDDLDDIEANVENFKGKQAAPFSKESSGDTLMVPDTPEDILCDDMVIEPFTVEEDIEIPVEPVATTEELMMDTDDDFDSGFPEPEGEALVDVLDFDDTVDALSFVKASGRVIALKGHVAVASFSKKAAGHNASLMNSEALPVAARAAVQADGLRKGLTSVGFTLNRVPATSDKVSARKMQEIQASVKADEARKQKEFASIFALAAAGLNRGNWKGFDNPLRASVEAELSRLGVQSPKRVVSSIFEQSGVQYAKTLLEISDRLSKMSASARKELAEMLDMTDVSASAKEEEADSEEAGADVVSSNIETRFAKPALLRAKVTSTAAGVSGASAVLAGNSPLVFASI